MTFRNDMEFNITALMNICAEWPALTVQEHQAQEPLFERLRQVLRAMSQPRGSRNVANLIPLIRDVLLRTADPDGQVPSLRVPIGPEWPTVAEWRDAQFDVLTGAATLQVRPRWPRISFLSAQADLFDDAFRGILSRPSHEVAADPLLYESMSLPTYTGHGQREAVRALFQLPEGRTLIANLPTGSGKSLLAHLPPLIEQDALLTLAIVPTVALAMDQARRMEDLLRRQQPERELPPLAFHGGLSSDERARVFQALRNGTQPILFTSPEYAVGSLRSSLQQAAEEARLHRVFIDEAHLVIGWGNGFRPAFQLLPALVRMLRARAASHSLRVVLASATLTDSTLRDLHVLFGPPQSVHVVSAVHLRPEIRYAHVPCSEDERAARVIEAVRLAPRPLILYVTRPDEADSWLGILKAVGFARIEKFTGQTSSVDREALLRRWAANELDGMVATSAFGLGVDKSDVRTVIHATLPESLDRYYQEVGRAGRDGRAGAAILLHTVSDAEQAQGIASPQLISDDKAYERWTGMLDGSEWDPSTPDLHWLDLRHLPARLQVPSDASLDWSVRTLTLMARAGLIELVALEATASEGNERTPGSIRDAGRAAIRILEDGHRHPETFRRVMSAARSSVYRASSRGLQAMVAVAHGQQEISHALAEMYSVHGSPWVPVARSCGGCSVDWERRGESVRYSSPYTARLGEFAPRELSVFEELRLPLEAHNLLVVSVPRDERFHQTASAVVKALAPLVSCHTIAMDEVFSRQHGDAVKTGLPRHQRFRTFFDVLSPGAREAVAAGDGEVRILIWTQPVTPEVWNPLLLSRARLEVLVVPSDLVHPIHSARRLVDTTTHVTASNLLQRLTS